MFFSFLVAIHFLLARKAHINGVVVVQRAQKPNVLKSIVCRYRTFIRIYKQTCCSGNDKITVGRALLKNTSVKGSDICMGIKMIPGKVGKIHYIAIGK